LTQDQAVKLNFFIGTRFYSMSTYATVYINGEIVCVVHYDGYLSNLGFSLLNLVNRGYYNWKDVLNLCKDHTLVFIHIKYVREDYHFCYKCGSYNKKQFYWSKEPTPEFLQNGSDEDEDRDPITNDWGWPANNDYDYNLLGEKLFVRLPLVYFPWVLVDEILILNESKLDDIYYEMHGVIEASEIDHDLYEKVRKNGPVGAGINLLRACKNAAEYMPWDPMVWVSYGAALKAGGKINESILAYKKATELKPDNPDFWWKYGQLLEDNNMKDQALTSYTTTTQLLPNDYNNWVKFANKLKSMGESDKLITAYGKMVGVLELEPESIPNLKKIAILYNNIGNREQAVHFFEKTIAKFIELKKLSSIEYEKKNLTEILEEIHFSEVLVLLNNTVLELYKKSVSESPNDPYSWYLLGKLYINLNDINNASQAFQKSVLLYKDLEKEGAKLPHNVRKMKEELVVILENAKLTNLLDELISGEKISQLELKIIHELEDLTKKKFRIVKEIFPRRSDGFILSEGMSYEIKNNHIVALSLHKCDLKELPDSIWELNALEKLDLGFNKLYTLSDSIENLNSLRVLNLRINELQSIPETIKHLKSLKSLNLNKNNLDSFPDVLKELNSLKSLRLEDNKFSFIPEFIGDFASLEVLDLSRNNLKSLPNSIVKMNSLKELKLDSNDLDTLPSDIGKLSTLESLNLGHNKNLSNLPKSIDNLKSLTKLQLSSTNINPLPESIGNLNSLKELLLDNLKLTTLPSTMKNLNSLEKLSLSRNFLNPPPTVLSEIKSLKDLNLHNNKITSIPESLCNLVNLETLSFHYNKITNLPESIGNLKSLKKLNLNSNQIVALPASIGNLKSIETLELDNNNLRNLPISLLNLNSLKSIGLYDNNLDLHSDIIKKLKANEIWVNF
jgi:leucine-rich repeat protein SHOC2